MMVFSIFILFLHPTRRFLRNLCRQKITLRISEEKPLEVHRECRRNHRHHADFLTFWLPGVCPD
ncbi:hypothetical protein CKO_02462 [Citrobacter koseri ATCC BAA-895]|uniref:Uncharacterized protein n=1 Tax=Citrobacter koseri (strain ATCC BAA-895 / CDC 4225-83 / SGSC4696) TaxID=290338 RepID=A8AJB6_CITK8|nr:hypothetical protein CKO_02462 [Citrobacter koseri ATCC BAA-895]